MTQGVYYAIIMATVYIVEVLIMKKLIFAALAIIAVLFVIRVIKEKKNLEQKDPLDLEDEE